MQVAYWRVLIGTFITHSPKNSVTKVSKSTTSRILLMEDISSKGTGTTWEVQKHQNSPNRLYLNRLYLCWVGYSESTLMLLAYSFISQLSDKSGQPTAPRSLSGLGPRASSQRGCVSRAPALPLEASSWVEQRNHVQRSRECWGSLVRSLVRSFV